MSDQFSKAVRLSTGRSDAITVVQGKVLESCTQRIADDNQSAHLGFLFGSDFPGPCWGNRKDDGCYQGCRMAKQTLKRRTHDDPPLQSNSQRVQVQHEKGFGTIAIVDV